MFEKIWGDMKRVRRDKVILAIIGLVIGVILLVWPLTSLSVIVRVIGAAMMVIGVYSILMYLVSGRDGRSVFALIGGILIGLVGGGLFARPEGLVAFIPVIIGIVVLLSGITNLFETFTLGRQRYGKWYISLIFALITIILGLLLIFRPFGVASFLTRLIGVAVIFDAVSNLWIISRISGGVKNIRKEIKNAAAGANIDIVDTVAEVTDEGPTPQE